MTPQRAVDLSARHTFGCPALAGEFLELDNAADIGPAGDWLRGHPDALILGDGSNLLLVRQRIDHVLQVGLRSRRIHAADEQWVWLDAAAGENWHELVMWSLDQGLCGLENLALIPGRVGAGPVQNIGAYGVEIAQCVEHVRALDIRSGRCETLSAADCRFAYRDSRFKRERGRWLITDVRLRLARHSALHLDYGDIRRELANAGIDAPTAPDVAAAVIRIRQARLPDPARLGNAGSFFKNPVVAQDRLAALHDRFPGMPAYPAGPGLIKIAAGWLIEQCGFKGVRRGDAGVHHAHALVLVNHGRATGACLLALAMEIRSAVKDRFGLELEPEPVIINPV